MELIFIDVKYLNFVKINCSSMDVMDFLVHEFNVNDIKMRGNQPAVFDETVYWAVSSVC